MSALPKVSHAMTVEEFLLWEEPSPGRWQLVDGEPVGMAPTTRTHGAIQSELCILIGVALEKSGKPCSVITTPGVIPHVRSKTNVRIPDLGVVCGGYQTEQAVLSEPVLLIEILSPSNESRTRANVWSYTTIPSVKEIALFHTASVGAEVWRRGADGNWPTEPETIEAGAVRLESVGVEFPLAAAYRTTLLSLAQGASA